MVRHRVGSDRPAYGRLGGQSRTYVEEGGVRVEDDAGVERVKLGKITSTTYGLRVNNPAGSVIIDGSSDMFRITAAGTLALSGFTSPLNPGATNNVSIGTGLSYTPISIFQWERSGGTDSYPSPYNVVQNSGALFEWYEANIHNTGGGITKVECQASSARSPATAIPGKTLRYYILEQVAF